MPGGKARRSERQVPIQAEMLGQCVGGARVSKAAFYAHFADKEDCFLAATREGGQLMMTG